MTPLNNSVSSPSPLSSLLVEMPWRSGNAMEEWNYLRRFGCITILAKMVVALVFIM
jgi:hypothetical protein